MIFRPALALYALAAAAYGFALVVCHLIKGMI